MNQVPLSTLDLTPSPRVLRMLGQIDFKPWQCLAELIDNSVDAFLTARGRDKGVVHPRVFVEVSSAQDIKSGKGTITVTDNGPGMGPEELEKAVRAGYSGNNPVDKLGLFGMGFNVATARLGSRTEVWSTRAEDDHWIGVRIDFDEIEQAESYRVPAMKRLKTPEEKNARGTQVIVGKLDKERASYLRSPGGLRATRTKLSSVYNKVIRDIGLSISVVSDGSLEGRPFCVWADSRAVETKGRFGRIPAVLKIAKDFGDRDYCVSCWVWLLKNEKTCPACGSDSTVMNRTRRVSGWIGIQRFFDQDDYGFDLLRNGRVIESKSKYFFSWTDPTDGTVIPEYPIEQQHWGGRIVGELNLDFVPLASHQKDAFDRNSPEWNLVVEAIRGKGPLLQEVRKHKGFEDPNESPLARLHAGYRRGNPPGMRWLVPGDSEGKGINRECQRWAASFWEGVEQYQTDDAWYKAVLQAEEARKRGKGTQVPPALEGDEEFPGDDSESASGEKHKGGDQKPDFDHEPLPSLSTSIRFDEIPNAPTLELRTEVLTKGRLPSGLHVELAVAGNHITAIFDPNHIMFTQTLTEPVDCLVQELAFQILQRSNVTQSAWPVSRVSQRLKELYFPFALESVEQIREDAAALLTDLIEHYVAQLSERAPISKKSLAEEDISRISKNVMLKEKAGTDRVEEVIKTGEFPRYLGFESLPRLLSKYPDLALDGRFFSVSFADVSSELRHVVLEDVQSALRDAVWAAGAEDSNRGPQAKGALKRAAASLQVLRAWSS